MTHSLSESHVAAWTRLIRTSQSCSERIEADLKRAGLPPLVWYDILIELRRAPDGRLGLSDIGNRLTLSKTNVTRVIDRMEERGVVERQDSPTDRRSALAVITEGGRKMLTDMWPAYRDSLARHFGAKLSAAEAQQLAALLDRLQAA